MRIPTNAAVVGPLGGGAWRLRRGRVYAAVVPLCFSLLAFASPASAQDVPAGTRTEFNLDFPITYTGSGSYQSIVSFDFGAMESATCGANSEYSVTLFANGTLTAQWVVTEDVITTPTLGKADCFTRDEPFVATRSGTHADGRFEWLESTFGSNGKLKGVYDSTSLRTDPAIWSNSFDRKIFDFGEELGIQSWIVSKSFSLTTGSGSTACGDASAPTCDGTCPAGQECVAGFITDCGCVPDGTGCGDASAPTCDGTCPVGEECVAGFLTDCGCVPDGTACGDASAPTCDGTCPLGEECVTGFLTDCGCVPDGTACGDASAPTCDGVCPVGETCVTGFITDCGCIPDTSDACGDASAPTCDGVCPVGETCVTGFITDCGCIPDTSDACGDASAPMCDGVCPVGETCVTGFITDCGCIPDTSDACGDASAPMCDGVCPVGEKCVTGFITDCGCVPDVPSPVCGNSIVEPGEDCDVGPDNGRPTLCCSATCKYEPGKICNPVAGLCDIPEVCDGLSVACPSQDVINPGIVCRPAADVCDFVEVCDGVSPLCPADAVRPATFICRIGFAACDAHELCNGVSPLCPANGVVAAGVLCRASTDLCDAPETCTGTGVLCPPDVARPAGAVCRASGGVCDIAETCDGFRIDCPGDGVAPVGTSCRSAVGVCDVEDACDGIAKDCTADVKSMNVCRGSVGDCDPAETCDGIADDCPGDARFPPGFVCREAEGDCDLDELCDGVSAPCPDDKKSNATCRPSVGDCDLTEDCDGVADDCPDNAIADDGTPCADDGAVCTDDICDDGGACTHPFDPTNDPVCVVTTSTTSTSTTTTTLADPGTVTGHLKISETSGGFGGILAESANFGSAVGGLSGLRDEGPSDVLVGAPDSGQGGGVWALDMNEGFTSVEFERKIAQNRGGFPAALEALDLFGQSAVSIGDLDGDGNEDWAVGAPGDDDGGTDEVSDLGALWILFLDRFGNVRDGVSGKPVQKISATQGGFGVGLAAGDLFGWTITAIGPTEPGERARLAVGAPGDDAAGDNAGAIWIVSLDAGGLVTAKQKIDASAVGAAGAGAMFGGGVAGLADVDGDENPDLAVGAPGDGSGSAWLLFLDAAGSLNSSRRLDPEDLSIDMLDEGDALGAAVAAIAGGVALGAPGDDDGGVDKGALWLLSLEDDGSLAGGQKISECFGSFAGTLDAGDRFGSAIASLGDLNKNGVEELAVGAPFDDDSRDGDEDSDRGAVWVLYLDSTRDNTFTCPVPTTTSSTTTTTLPVVDRPCGDASGDGVVTARDALRALQNAIGIGGCVILLCDVNGDGQVTATDALAILRAAVGLGPPGGLPCGNITTTSSSTLPTIIIFPISKY